MITLIYGGSGSGKSEFAEGFVCEKHYDNQYYLATMAAFDDEAKARIQKHRDARAGKGFETIEQPFDAAKITNNINENGIILLECLSNLVANEMFRDGQIIPSEKCIEKIFEDLKVLAGHISELVIVSNDIFDDGIQYDETTMDYLKALGALNSMLASEAEEVYEVVVGIPLKIKG